MGYLAAIAAVMANVLASVTLKLAVDGTSQVKNDSSWLVSALPFGLSAIFYGLAFAMYALALKFLPLHIAQPLTSALPLVIIAVVSALLLRENITSVTVGGLVLVSIGLVLIALGARQ